MQYKAPIVLNMRKSARRDLRHTALLRIECMILRNSIEEETEYILLVLILKYIGVMLTYFNL